MISLTIFSLNYDSKQVNAWVLRNIVNNVNIHLPVKFYDRIWFPNTSAILHNTIHSLYLGTI